VQEFIGPTSAVLVTDAGTIKAYIQPLFPTLDSLRRGLAALEGILRQMDLGRQEMLVGVDGCLCGRATHLQTVVHLQGQPQVSLANTTAKLYPTEGERRSLLGWRLCKSLERVPEELTLARRIHTAAGMFLVLVCNDATLLKGYSRKPLKDPMKLRIRQHLLDQAMDKPRPEYILIATHWQGTNPETGKWSGDGFRQAADYLAAQTGATVVTTMRAPLQELAPAACRFPVVGPRAEKVATLLVRDTTNE
jgi:hypothetical protein